MDRTEILRALRLDDTNPGGFSGAWTGSGPEIEVRSPIDGAPLALVRQVTEAEYDAIVDRADRKSVV